MEHFFAVSMIFDNTLKHNSPLIEQFPNKMRIQTLDL